MKFGILLLTFLLATLAMEAQGGGQKQDSLSIDTCMQTELIPNKYFKFGTHHPIENKNENCKFIEVYNQANDSLLQVLDSIYTTQSLHTWQINDYNFDGYYEFSLLDQFYAGPNTSRLYYLYDPKTDRFFLSEIQGTSLEFDSANKRIYENNQCCAGTKVVEAIYKLENNEMILVEKHCYELDMIKYDADGELDYKEVECEAS